jgi:hypothetical protein
MDETKLDKNYHKGDSGPYVRLIQEWLSLNGINLVIDGVFGSATDAAVRKFQTINTLAVDGEVGPITYGRLIEPVTNALKPIPVNGRSVDEMVAAYAQQHLKQHPREVGGQNMGPWVRYYMRGNEGVDWPWCAGFISTLVKQACKSLRIPLPIKLSDSCIELAKNAMNRNLFLSETDVLTDKNNLKPGSIFLNRKSPDQWSHTGIVIAVEPEVFHTIEGNTNDEGSSEGYEVCQRIRSYPGKDFILTRT